MTVALISIILIYVLAVVTAVAMFGVVEIQQLIWPTFAVYRVIEIPGAFTREYPRSGNGHMGGGGIHDLLAVFFFAAVTILGRILSLKEHSFTALPLALLIYFLALVPNNVSQVYNYLDAFSLYLQYTLWLCAAGSTVYYSKGQGARKGRGKWS